jgi:conjugative transposon TraM protein
MSTNNQENKSKLTDEQKQKLKKYAVFALMGIICAGCMWLIFKPSANEKAVREQQSGFNTDIPDPRNEGIVGDKRDAYEQEQVRQRQAERMRSLHDFGSLLNENNSRQSDNELSLLTEEIPASRTGGTGTAPRHTTTDTRSLQHSINAQQDLTRTLGNFYERPRNDPERERLERELNGLRQRLDEQESMKNTADEQMAFMERSFQMASRFLPQGMETGMTIGSVSIGETEQQTNNANRNVSGKTLVAPVSQVREQIVSALPQEISTEDFISAFSQPRNMGFFTAVSEKATERKNTISAVIYADQTITNGENVRLRLVEPMRAGGMLIPQNSLLSGVARIQGERLQITISSLEHKGTILPVEIFVYDTDGQRGIFIPNIHELNAAKEIIANMGTSAGTSVNLSTDAGEQVVADMGRNTVQGVSQFFSRKMREVKVNLKAGYKVLLLPNDR